MKAIGIEKHFHLLDDPYFSLPAPKSTGLEHFNMNWLDSSLTAFKLSPGVVRNSFLMRRIATALPDVIVGHTTHYRCQSWKTLRPADGYVFGLPCPG